VDHQPLERAFPALRRRQPELFRLLDAAARGEFKRVLIASYDILADTPAERAAIVMQFGRYGVTIETADGSREEDR
jgi:DNA invertase Pin-like site-specific DNA recombinase